MTIRTSFAPTTTGPITTSTAVPEGPDKGAHRSSADPVLQGGGGGGGGAKCSSANPVPHGAQCSDADYVREGATCSSAKPVPRWAGAPRSMGALGAEEARRSNAAWVREGAQWSTFNPVPEGGWQCSFNASGGTLQRCRLGAPPEGALLCVVSEGAHRRSANRVIEGAQHGNADLVPKAQGSNRCGAGRGTTH